MGSGFPSAVGDGLSVLCPFPGKRGMKLHTLGARHKYRKKLERMKLLRLWAVPAHALLIAWLCR